MRRDRHGDQHIAGAARPRHALAAEPDLLAVGDAGGNFDFDILAGRQPQALGDAVRRIRQRHRQRRRDIGAAAEILGLEAAPRCCARRAAPRRRRRP